IVAPTDLLLGEKVGLSEAVKGCNGYLTGLIFFTALCFAKDVAEIKMDAENVVFGSPISDAAKVRLISLIADIKEKVPAARELSDDAVIIELVNSQLVKK
ncbi:MAG: hypothetical protein ACXVCP_14055, partial [Bdellovibrio sp.]